MFLFFSFSFYFNNRIGNFTRETDSRLVDSDFFFSTIASPSVTRITYYRKTNFKYLRVRAHRRTVRTVNHHTKKDLSIFAYRDSRERVRIRR